jgi:hypothetical protein
MQEDAAGHCRRAVRALSGWTQRPIHFPPQGFTIAHGTPPVEIGEFGPLKEELAISSSARWKA